MEIVIFQRIYYILVFCLGAGIYSFLGTVIDRMSQKELLGGKCSYCPHCRKQLKGYELIPVVSWFFLGGKCSGCRARIPFRYPLLEAFGGFALLLTLFCWGTPNGDHRAVNGQVCVMFSVFAILTCVAFIDADTMEIPDGLLAALLVPTLLSVFVFPQMTLFDRVMGFFAVSLPLLLLTLAVPGAFGGGDIKLMAVCGFLTGWKLCLLSFGLAVFAGGIYGSWLLLTRKKGGKEHFAFGPFLCVSVAIVLVAGERICSGYLQSMFLF